MGNKLTPQTLISNLNNFKPTLTDYEVVNQTNPPSDKNVVVWKHKKTNIRLIQKKQFLRTWLQFHQLLQIFAFRYNSDQLIAAKFLYLDPAVLQKINTSSLFPQSWSSLFYEQSILNLNYFNQIPQQDGAYFLCQSLKGFQKLLQITQFPFEVKQQMFHITQSKQLKVWLSETISELTPINQLRPLANQSQMVHQILCIVKNNIFFCTSSQKNINYRKLNQIEPILCDYLINESPQTLKQALQLAQKYFKNQQIAIGDQLNSFKDLRQHEMIKIRQMTETKIRKNWAQSKKNTKWNLFNNLNRNQNFQNGFKNQIKSGEIKDLKAEIQHEQIQSRYNNFKINQAKNAYRAHLNKRSGISLVNKSFSTQKSTKQYKEMNADSRNNHSLIVIKPKPISNDNQNSLITISKRVQNVPPKVSLRIDQVKRTLRLQKYNDPSKISLLQKHSSYVRRKDSVSNTNHKKGINLTVGNQKSIPKTAFELKTNIINQASNLFLGSDANITRRLNSIKFFNSNFIANQNSNFSVLNFPAPLYKNDLSLRVNNILNANFPVNASSIISLDPFLPNQSLTRFFKERRVSLSGKQSANQSYEMPKIYVHSPKAKNKIFRVQQGKQQTCNSVTTEISEQNTRKKTQKIIRQDFEMQEDEQLYRAKWRQSHLDQYNSYIEKNESEFTHPTLYQYITNNSSEWTIQRQKPQTEPKKTYFDYLANVQISQSLDYQTAQKMFEVNDLKPKQSTLPIPKENLAHHYSINDFPTIEEIQQNPHSEKSQKQNRSFIPIPLNLIPQSQRNDLPPSSVRRGCQESVVVEYKKFYDQTNRSNISPNKHYFSPLKKNKNNMPNSTHQNIQNKRYSTANNWRICPSQLFIQRPVLMHNAMIGKNKQVQFNQSNDKRHDQSSPISKIIFRRQKPTINPLLLQDIYEFRQGRIY